MRSRPVLAAVLVVLAVLWGIGTECVTTPASAATILDQSFLTGVGSVSGNVPFSQTFTVGVAGTLSSVEVRIFGVSDITVDIIARWHDGGGVWASWLETGTCQQEWDTGFVSLLLRDRLSPHDALEA
jgi:hypothetical protein